MSVRNSQSFPRNHVTRHSHASQQSKRPGDVDLHEPFIALSAHDVNPCTPASQSQKPDQTLLITRRPHPFMKNKPIRRRLKKETDVFRNDFIEYAAEIPVRVAIRLEFLLGTNKVRLNDKKFMDKLHSGLVEEELVELRRVEHKRAVQEQERVKKLVVEGEMEPPREMAYLYNHPVFRVNKMLRRLEQYENSFFSVPKPNIELTPCEPFEYDAGKYFRHLHRTGRSDWLPKWVKKERREKLKAKITRARERKLAKEKAAEDNAKRNSQSQGSRKSGGSHLHWEDEDDEDETETEFISLFVRKPSKSSEYTEDQVEGEPSDKRRRSSNHRRIHIGETLPKQSIQEREETLKQREQERQGRIVLRRKELQETFQQTKDERLAIEFGLKKHITNPALMIELHEKSKDGQLPDQIQEDELSKLKKCYKLGSDEELAPFAPYQNGLFKSYFDKAEDVDELFYYAKEIKKLYDRKIKITDEFVRFLGKFMELQRLGRGATM